MRLFIDTGSVDEVRELARWGVLAGATTNPTLLAAEAGDPGEVVREICDLVDGPVSAEVVSDEPAGMIREGHALRGLHEHVVVKVPFCAAGLEATRALADDSIPVNMTLVFSPTQAILAAEAGAIYISCFMGRLDDVSVDSAEVLAQIVGCLRPSGTGGVLGRSRALHATLPASLPAAQVLAASIRHPAHVMAAAQLGCDVATIPAKVLRQMLEHPLTAKGIERFAADWRSRPEFADWLGGLAAAA